MSFKPVTFPQGYGMAENVTTWGGGAIFDGHQYHIYVSRMTNDCLLQTWGSNSRIDHGIADTVTGPYKFSDVAVNTWAHNAAPVTLADGSFAIFHIGSGTGSPTGGKNCTPSSEPEWMQTEEAQAATAATAAESFQTFQEYDRANHAASDSSAGSSIHTSKSLMGPWEPLANNTLGGCNNPAPWVHRNGTIFIVCGGDVKKSDSIEGPWEKVTSFSHSGGPAGNWEDPYLYTDKRGHFHLIYHGTALFACCSTFAITLKLMRLSVSCICSVQHAREPAARPRVRQLHRVCAPVLGGRLHVGLLSGLPIRNAGRAQHWRDRHRGHQGAPEALLRQNGPDDAPVQRRVLRPELPQRPQHRLRGLQVRQLGLHAGAAARYLKPGLFITHPTRTRSCCA